MVELTEPWISIFLKVPINNGRGEWEFPSQLQQNLFQNTVHVRGLYSESAYPNKQLFVTTNTSEHGRGQKVIRNILGVFEFKRPKLYQFNPQYINAPINKISYSPCILRILKKSKILMDGFMLNLLA